MGFYIPDTMKKFDNWVVWRKGARGQKPPYDPRTGQKANPTKKCVCYDDALAYYEYGGKYDGIGFILTPDCNLTFIDLDNCIDEDGNESPLAEELQALFADSYIELSQSEKGMHIVCIGKVPYTIKTKDIEIYSSNQYIAMTGNTTNANEPQEAQKQLDLIFNRYKTEKAEFEPHREPQGHIYKCVIDAKTLIEVISHSRQGEKWLKLHNGEWRTVLDAKGNPYPSHSEAMQAYIAITNYFAGGKVGLIEQVFMQSKFPLENPKYKNAYYVRLAARKAQGTATGSTTKNSANIRRNITDHTERRRRRF